MKDLRPHTSSLVEDGSRTEGVTPLIIRPRVIPRVFFIDSRVLCRWLNECLPMGEVHRREGGSNLITFRFPSVIAAQHDRSTWNSG